MSQSELILSYLQQGNRISPLQALDLFHCFRLGARIYDLKRRGIAIKTVIIEDKKSGKHFAEYSLR